jgi:DNA-binding MarR family transcriptional regulator
METGAPLPHDPEPDADADLLPTLVGLLFGLTKSIEGVVGGIYVELGLTEPLADALWQLDPAAPTPSMRQWAARLRCDPSSVTFLADRLTERGLIEVRVDPADRRRKTVALTPGGERTRRDLLAAFTTRSPLARLSRDEQRRLRDLLGRMAAPTATSDPVAPGPASGRARRA